MTLHTLNSPELPFPAGHYSHVCIAGQTAYISGQLPIDAKGRPLSSEPFEVQVIQVLSNLDRCLEAAGSSRQQLVQIRVYVTDIDDWATFDWLYAEWIGSHRPARAVAGVKQLHYGLSIEIEAIAVTSAG